jgi:ectoine hydroxylase-related dioxygenase (phytanoyl-CoA dioxygenase family)
MARNTDYRPLEISFVRDGFAVLESFVNKVELKEIAPLVESVLTSSHELACTRPHNTLAPLRWNDPTVRLLLKSAGVQALKDVICADDLKWISGYVSIKEPHSPPLWWHQDWWCWDHPSSYRRMAPQVAVLCYLADTNAKNGALRVLRGSHLKSAPIHAVLPEAHGHSAEGLEPGHAAMSDLPGQVTLCLQAGDAAVIDYRLLHSTHGNASDSRRDCILLSFTPSWRRLPNDIKAHLIAHPAQPSGGEALTTPSVLAKLFPKFSGPRQDLPLNRNAPSNFEVVD